MSRPPKKLPLSLQDAMKIAEHPPSTFTLSPSFRKMAEEHKDITYPPEFALSDRMTKLDEIRAYFEFCENNQEVPTINGLATAVGLTRGEFMSKLKDIGSPFSRMLCLARQVISEYVEKMILTGKPPVGLIFWLKNHDDWVDKHEVDSNMPLNFASILNIINQPNALSEPTSLSAEENTERQIIDADAPPASKPE